MITQSQTGDVVKYIGKGSWKKIKSTSSMNVTMWAKVNLTIAPIAEHGLTQKILF